MIRYFLFCFMDYSYIYIIYFQIFKDMVVKCLIVVNQKGYNFIFFFCFGSGYNGYLYIEVVVLMFEAVIEYDKLVFFISVQKVNFVVLSNDRKFMGVGRILVRDDNKYLLVLEDLFFMFILNDNVDVFSKMLY